MGYTPSIHRAKAMVMREKLFNWLTRHEDLIITGNNCYQPLLQECFIKETGNKITIEQLRRWLYMYRQMNGVKIRYCPTKPGVRADKGNHV